MRYCDMSPTTLTANLPYTGFVPTAFDDSFINVPQAQDAAVYAGYTLLDEELGLINAYAPTPADELALAKEHDPVRIARRARRAAIRMDALDDGSGRLRGGARAVALLAATAPAPRRADDVAARDASLAQEHRARLLAPDGAGAPPAARPPWYDAVAREAKERFLPSSSTGTAPRTVYTPTPVALPQPLEVAYSWTGPQLQLGYDGQHPTPALLQADTAPECIDPILLDDASWSTDYRMEGLRGLADDEVGYSLSVLPASDALAPTAASPKKRAMSTKKITKVVDGKKEGKKVSKTSAKLDSTPRMRRNSLAARGNTLF